MFEHELQIGEVKVRVEVDGPVDVDSLPLRFQVSTETELRELVRALGGPGRFHGSDAYLHGFAVDGDLAVSMMIHMVGELGTDEPRPETRGQAAFKALCAEHDAAAKDAEVMAGG